MESAVKASPWVDAFKVASDFSWLLEGSLVEPRSRREGKIAHGIARIPWEVNFEDDRYHESAY